MEKFKNFMLKVKNAICKVGSVLLSFLKWLWKCLTAFLIAVHIMQNADEIKEKAKNKKNENSEEEVKEIEFNEEVKEEENNEESNKLCTDKNGLLMQ